MQDWVKALLGLQELDISVAKLEVKLAEIPVQEAETKKMYQAETDASAAAKKTVQDIELTIRRLEGEITSLKTQKENFQAKTSLIKNNDEYRAALLQIEQCDKAVSEAEDKQIVAMDELEAAKKVLAEKNATLQAAQKKAEAVFAELETSKGNCQKELAVLSEKRPQLASAVEPALLKRYERLRTARNNHPTNPCFVPADDGNCGRCHLSITPQELNDTIKGKVVSCHFCGALLYSTM